MTASVQQELFDLASTGRLCGEHGRQARCEVVRLYVLQLRPRWWRLPEAERRVRNAELGAAVLEDVIFLNECAQLLFAMARVVECKDDLAWQQVAAAVEERRAVLEELLALHSF